MSSFIIHQETIPIRVSAFHKFPVKAGIDRGSSLTKIAFVSKDSPHDAEIIQLHCVTFLNEHFIDAVKFLKENAQLPNEGSLHVTGVGAATYQDQIKELFGRDVVYIDEKATIGYGPYLFVNNCEPEDIFHPIPDHMNSNFKPQMLEDVMKSFKGKLSASDKPFPALVVYVGSGCGVMKVEEDGSGRLIASTALSGKPFMGLANVLLGTADYNEIMELAERGDRLKADNRVGDLLKDPDTPYGNLPSNMPSFSFGKAASKSWDRSSCDREDLAASLIGLIAADIGYTLFSTVNTTGLNKIYITGNFFRHELPRKLVLEHSVLLGQEALKMEINFFRTGQTGALAAMFLDPEDCAKLLR